jgi:hypothetical protein
LIENIDSLLGYGLTLSVAIMWGTVKAVIFHHFHPTNSSIMSIGEMKKEGNRNKKLSLLLVTRSDAN